MPVVALAVFVLLLNLDLAGLVTLSGGQILRDGLASGAAAAIATAIVLMGERREWPYVIRQAVSLAIGAAAAFAVLRWQSLGVAPFALLGATILLVPLAPYIRGGRAGFWEFLWELIHAGALAVLAIGVFCLGVSAICAGLQFLLPGMNMSLIYGHVWSIGMGFVGPLFALSLIPMHLPSEDREPETDVIIGGIRILSDFVAAPLLAVYALVLHAYAIKVLFAAELPKNKIGWMVLSFGLCVLLLRIVVHPLATQSRLPTRLFLRWWAVPLVVPLALLADAIWLRISDYGVTPQRYGLALFAVFLGLVILAQVPRRLRGDIRVIPALGAILLAVASIGPWGIQSATGRSQAHRLVEDLQTAGAVQNGRLAVTPSLQREQAEGAQATIALLEHIGQLDRLRPLFAGRPGDPFAAVDKDPDSVWELSSNIQTALNIAELPDEADTTGAFSMDAGGTGALDISGYDTVVPQLDWSNRPTAGLVVPGLPVVVEINSGGFVLAGTRERIVFPTVALRAAIDQRVAAQQSAPDQPQPPLFVEETVEGHRIGVLFEGTAGLSSEQVFLIQTGKASLFLRRADWKEG